MIISIDIDKVYDKNLTPFHDKNTHKTKNVRELPSIWKGLLIYEKPSANITLSGKRLDTLPLRSGTSQECSVSPLLFNIVLDILEQQSAKNWSKRHSYWEEMKLSLFADDMISYTDNPKEPSKKY